MLSDLAGETIDFDAEVAASEAATGFRNVALGNFMKSFGKIDNDVAAVLDFYFHQCAVAHELPPARQGRRLPLPRRRPSRWPGTVRRS